jgi:hypothetical protein
LDWQKVSLPDSVRVFSVAASGSFVLLGTSVGVYYSNNSGALFEVPLTGLPAAAQVVAVAAASPYAVAVEAGGGVWRSVDGGRRWSFSSTVPAKAFSAMMSGDTVVVGTDDGLFWSLDLGRSWRRWDTGDDRPAGSIRSFVVGAVPPVALSAGAGPLVLQGSRWLRCGEGLAAPYLTAGAWDAVRRLVVMPSPFGWIEQEVPGGCLWRLRGGALDARLVSAMASSGGLVWAGTQSGSVFSRAAGSSSWLAAGLAGVGWIHAMAASSGRVVVAAESGAYTAVRPDIPVGVVDSASVRTDIFLLPEHSCCEVWDLFGRLLRLECAEGLPRRLDIGPYEWVRSLRR